MKKLLASILLGTSLTTCNSPALAQQWDLTNSDLTIDVVKNSTNTFLVGKWLSNFSVSGDSVIIIYQRNQDDRHFQLYLDKDSVNTPSVASATALYDTLVAWTVGGGTPGTANDLATTLAVGNNTGGTDILVDAGDSLDIADATANTIAAFSGNSKLQSLATATYPSLTELSYVKGVTSAIQTQINTKVASTRNINTTSPITGGGDLSADRTIACATCGVTTTGLAQFAATTSAELLGVLSNETGGGLAVFNDSPVFLDNITVGTAGTATGDILINGTTSGTVTITTNDAAGTWQLTLPADDGDAGEFLQTNGSGVSSWEPASASLVTVANEATDPTCFLGFFTAATGSLQPKTNANINLNSNTGLVTVTSLTTTAGIIAGTTLTVGSEAVPDIDGGAVLGSATQQWNGAHFFDLSTLSWAMGNATITHSVNALTSNVEFLVPDEAYGAGWDGDLSAAPKNAIYDKIETMPTGLPPGFIYGCIMSNAADANNDITISAGKVRDESDTEDMVLSAAITKQLDAAWAVGDNQGGINTGAEANSTWYEVHIIKRTDTDVVDVMFTTTANRATLPANYDKQRRIGWIRNDGSGNILAFTQVNDHFTLTTKVNDVSATATASGTSRTLTVPPSCIARFRAACLGNTSINAENGVVFSELVETDIAPTNTNGFLSIGAGDFAIIGAGHVELRVNSSSQIRDRAITATGSMAYDISTFGWIDGRLRLSSTN